MKKRGTSLQTMRENFFVSAGWDNVEQDEWEIMMDAFFAAAARVMKPKGSMVVFSAVIKVESVIRLAERHGFYYKTTGCWHKRNPMPRNMNYHFINSTESWVYFVYKGRSGTFNNNGMAIHDYVETPVTPKSERRFGKHPTQKPVALMEYFVKLLSNEGDWILDPFMGSGTTGLVARQCGRNFIGVEVSADYYDIANQRIQNL